MLTKIQSDNTKPVIIKTVDGEDVSRRSAFPSDKEIIFTVTKANNGKKANIPSKNTSKQLNKGAKTPMLFKNSISILSN